MYVCVCVGGREREREGGREREINPFVPINILAQTNSSENVFVSNGEEIRQCRKVFRDYGKARVELSLSGMRGGNFGLPGSFLLWRLFRQ